MNKKFIKLLLEKVNTIFDCYYEEAPKNAKFPFGIIPTITLTPLDYGFNCVFDIELNFNELSNISIEQTCDDLRIGLDNFSYQDDDIGFHIGFDTQYLTKQNEQDLVYRRLSFVARIF